MPKYKVETTHIDYCVQEEDVMDLVNVRPEYTTAWYDAIDKKIEEIKQNLPQHLILEIECDEEDLDDMVCDAIGNETFWLVNSFSYEIKEVNHNA